MLNCKNCKAIIKEGSKFCTNCGTPVEDHNQRAKLNDTSPHLEAKKSKSPSMLTKIIFWILTIVALFFIVKSIVTNLKVSRNSLSVAYELSKIEGEWYDPSGVLLGSEDDIITFTKKGEKIVGEDSNKKLYIGLLVYRTNEYGGLVAVGDDNENYSVKYDHFKSKLFFVGDRSGKQWYLQKVKRK